MKINRTKRSIYNSSVALITQVILIGMSFLARTVFIRLLGVGYLGVNGLFSNILLILSFAELGVGTAITYAMYKPLANNDERLIAAYMNIFEKVYHIIGIAILMIGLALIPNLNFFIKDTTEVPSMQVPLWVIYVLFLLDTVSSYFFTYKRTIILASQNGYINSLNEFIFSMIRYIVQLVVLFLWHDYLLYLVIQIACTLLGNISISIKADKLFPYLSQNRDAKLDKQSVTQLKKNVISMSFTKLGGVIVSGVDNVLISKYVGIVAIGCYSNYIMVMNMIRTVFNQIFSPVTASVGDFVATKTEEESYELYRRLFFVNAYIAIFFTTCLSCLINSFIEIVWGKNLVFSMVIVELIMFNFYLDRMRQTNMIFIDTNGLFWEIKWKCIVESIVNYAVSLFLMKYMKLGIVGVVVGTIISNFTTNFWWEAYVVFKHALHRSMKVYFLLHLKYTATLAVSFLLTNYIVSRIQVTLAGFVLQCFVALIIPNLVIFLACYKTKEYAYVIGILKHLLEEFMGRKTKEA